MIKWTTTQGYVPTLVAALALVACSHSQPQSERAKNPSPPASAQAAGTAQQGLLGEEQSNPETSDVQQQKKVITTVVVTEKIPTVRESTVRADINRMDANQFMAIGFPSDLAANIVQYRDLNGPYRSVNDLTKVAGVSRPILDKFDGSLGVSLPQGTSAAGISGISSSITGLRTAPNHSSDSSDVSSATESDSEP